MRRSTRFVGVDYIENKILLLILLLTLRRLVSNLVDFAASRDVSVSRLVIESRVTVHFQDGYRVLWCEETKT